VVTSCFVSKKSLREGKLASPAAGSNANRGLSCHNLSDTTLRIWFDTLRSQMCYHTSRGYCCPTEKTAGRLPAFGHGVQGHGRRAEPDCGAARAARRPPARRKITRRNRRRAGPPAAAGECAQRTVAAGRARGDRPAAAEPMIAPASRGARRGAPPAGPGRPCRGARRPAPAARAAALPPGRRAPAGRLGRPSPRHLRRPAPGIPVSRLNCRQDIPE